MLAKQLDEHDFNDLYFDFKFTFYDFVFFLAAGNAR